jgi:hypothetical protein
MGILLRISKRYVPPLIQKHELARLFEATAEAFETEVPASGKLAFPEMLDLYARFTREESEKAIRQGRQLEVQSRLFEKAWRIGQRYKKTLGISGDTQVMEAGKLIFGLMEIDFQGEAGGQIVIRRCFFSKYYSSLVCRLVSALDEGLLAGLSGGGCLRFKRRITEGQSHCQAFLEKQGSPQ